MQLKFVIKVYNVWVLFNSECLAHGEDICPDCLLEKICGDINQTEECNFMKKPEAKKIAEDQILKTQGKLRNYQWE